MLFREAVSLVLLDLMLPDLPGEELCKRIRSGFYDAVASDIPIIMISAKVNETSIVQGLSMGADDYVTKPFSPRELAARIQAILRRTGQSKSAARGTVCAVGDLLIDRENRRVLRAGLPITLTAREYEILALLASCPHKIFTRDEIIDAVGGNDFDGFDRAVDSHIKNLRQKLGDKPRNPRYIETVYGMGYRIAVKKSTGGPAGGAAGGPA